MQLGSYLYTDIKAYLYVYINTYINYQSSNELVAVCEVLC